MLPLEATTVLRFSSILFSFPLTFSLCSLEVVVALRLDNNESSVTFFLYP